MFTDDRDRRNQSLAQRMEDASESIACTIVSIEEVLRGWLAVIHRLQDVHSQIPAYVRLNRFIEFMGDWEITPFDESAADQFVALRRRRIRIGTMDLKIASIAIVNDAVLLTANTRDFLLVPGLRFENWLES